jgi:hypothetical protein
MIIIQIVTNIRKLIKDFSQDIILYLIFFSLLRAKGYYYTTKKLELMNW